MSGAASREGSHTVCTLHQHLSNLLQDYTPPEIFTALHLVCTEGVPGEEIHEPQQTPSEAHPSHRAEPVFAGPATDEPSVPGSAA